jgi:chemotaxis protein MotD
MTKLSGTSAQTFSGLADSLNVRGAARGGKAVATKSQADGSFNDLLQTVSSLAKRALGDQAVETHVKTGSLHTHLAHPAEMDDMTGEPDGSEADPADPTHLSGTAEDDDEAPGAQVKLVSHDRAMPEFAAKVELPDRPTLPPASSEQIAAAMPQLRSPAAPAKDAGARGERLASARRDDQMVVARAADAAAPASAPETMRVRAGSTGSASLPQEAGASPKSPAAGAGFEAVAANVERATRVVVRDVLPETTKVTVVQQETHFPPAQFSAPQQVANALVAELKEVPASTASAAPDLAASQSGAPDQPLRILTISLEPPALGNVTVRLRLVGSEVSVHLAAERKDTSQMLEQQRESIRDLMQSAGYVADVAPVRHGSLDASPNGSGQSQPQLANQQQQPSSQSQGAFDGNGSSSRQSDDGARQARQERQPNQETRHDQDAAQQLRRGPVYL